MKPLFSRTFFAAISSLIVFSSCERAPVQSSFVSLQLPSVSESGQSGLSHKTGEALSCNPCLKAFVVQASGSGFEAIRTGRYHADLSEDATQLEGEVTLEVPVGSQRRFQVLALYRMGSGTMSVYYGSAQADLNTEAPKVEVSLSFVGSLGGSLMGRYLTTADEGPTGKVNISYVHPSGLSFDMPGGEIINGWFNFHAGQTVDLTYRLESDKSTLFSDLKSTSTNNIKSYINQNAVAGAFKPIAHMTAPRNDYWVKNSNFPYEMVRGRQDFVYGYFAEPGVDLSSKKVCIQSIAGATSLDNTSVSASSGDASLAFRTTTFGASLDATTLARTIYGTGGAVSGDCTALNSGQLVYDMDQITLVKDQYNGRGNDHARSIAGAFTYIVSYDATLASSDPSSGGYKAMKYESDKNTVEYKLRGLPDVFSGNKPVYNSIRLFKKPNAANGGYDDIDCHEKWFADKGFTEVTGFAQSPTLFTWAPPENNIKFTLNFNPNATDGYIACPTSGSDMNHLGGMYLGALGPIPEATLDPVAGSYNMLGTPAGTPSAYNLQYLIYNSAQNGIVRDISVTFEPVSGYAFGVWQANVNCSPAQMSSCDVDVTYTGDTADTVYKARMVVQYKIGAETRISGSQVFLVGQTDP